MSLLGLLEATLLMLNFQTLRVSCSPVHPTNLFSRLEKLDKIICYSRILGWEGNALVWDVVDKDIGSCFE